MKVFIEPGDKPELRELVYNLRRCGLEIDIRTTGCGERPVSLREDDIRAAIMSVTSCFTVSTQWAAIYRVLVDYCGYPEEMTSFCRKIERLMSGNTLPYPCSYQSIQKTLASRAIFQKHYNEWKELPHTRSDRAFERQMMVADLLVQHLEKVGL